MQRQDDAFQILMDEHRVIEQVLQALETAADQEVPLSFYERAIQFIREYADAFHHGKEEARLFPAMVDRGMPAEHGPIGVMLHEHQVGRAHVAAMRDHLQAGDHEGLRRESLAYAALLRDHIAKEDQVLYPMGRNLLGPEGERDLRARYGEVPEPEGGAASYLSLAAELLDEVSAHS